MDDLSDEDLAGLRAALTALRTELQTNLGRSEDAAKPVTLDQQAVGRISRVDAIQQQKMTEANRQRQQVRLAQVKAAFEAMETGDYGDCRRCEEPIGLRRLRAQPESAICLDCQSAMERR